MKKVLILFMGLLAITSYALEVGDAVPDFALQNQDGRVWKLSEHLGGKPVVVYFYPAAMTKGCTKQACAYRDRISEGNVPFEVIGISADPVENLKWFKKSENLNFALLSDPEAKVAKVFGVDVATGKKVIKKNVDGAAVALKRDMTIKRWTFIIDPAGKIIYKDDKVRPMEDLGKVLNFVAPKN